MNLFFNGINQIRKRLILKLLITCCCPITYAANLMDIYEAAVENDPTFKSAYSTFMSASEAVPQARSGLLPHIGLSSQVSRNTLGISAGNFQTHQWFNSRQWSVSASQTLFNYEEWTKVQQAKASVKAAHATFNNAAQDLMIRTAQAYLDVLLAKDTLEFAEAKQRANKRQYEQAQQRFKVGLDTITSAYEAKAAYDQSIAVVITAKNNQINKNEALRKLTNRTYETFSRLKENAIPLLLPQPNNVDEWVATGLRQNFNLSAAKFNLQVAREKIKSHYAKRVPTFNLEGTNIRTKNSSLSTDFFVPAHRDEGQLMITMSLPLLHGGLVLSQTKQAQYDFQTSSEQFEAVYRDVIVKSRIAFNTIVDGINQINADKQTVISQKNALKSTEAQFKAGTRTMVDVVSSQQHLFEAQEKLAKDQYNYILSILELKFLAGTLNANDLKQINGWLAA